MILGLQTREIRELSFFFNEGGSFLSAETFPLPLFKHFRAGVARPGELTCHFFFFLGKT